MNTAASGILNHMRRLSAPGTLLLLLFASFTVSSHAQGQTPTSPRERPTTQQPTAEDPPTAREQPTTSARRGLGSTTGRGSLGSNSGSGGMDPFGSSGGNNNGGMDPFGSNGQQGSSIGKDGDKESGRRGGREERDSNRSRRGGEEGGKTGGAAGLAEGATPGTVPGGAAGASGGPVTGGGGAAGGAAGGGGGGATLSKGGASTVNVVGEGSFEPILNKPVVYGEVPEEGEMITYLEGPMTVGEFVNSIHLATEWNVLATEAARVINLEFIIANKTPKEALEVLKFYDLVYDWDEDSKFLKVYTKDEWLEEKYGEPEAHEFIVKNADVLYMESLLTSLLSSTGRIVTDQRTGRIYVWDTPDNLQQMSETFEAVDVPLKRQEYNVQHADLADIEAVVTGLLSPNGSVLSDARTGQLIVWDGPATLKQVSDAVERLDVPVESRTYQIININAEDLVENLEVLLSARGMIQVDPRFNALVITDLPTRLEKMENVIKTLDRELETKTWTIQYADPDFIADQIELYIPSEMGEVVVNFDVHQVTVTGLPERIAKVDEMITQWDIPRQQVLIEAFIVEVGTDVQREFNINWSYFGNINGNPVIFSQGEGSKGIGDRDENPVTFGQLPYGVPLYGGLQLNEEGQITRPVVTDLDGETVFDRLAGNKIAATLDYLDQKDKVRILNSPRVVVQDGEEALFQNATQVPFVSGSTNFNNSSVNNFSTSNRVEFIDVGTILSVMPRVSEDSNILLDVTAEDSTFTEKVIISNNLSSTVPEKTTRGAETQLRVHSGDTVVLGGLRRDKASDSVSKVPVLGDLPLVGQVFRSPKKESRQSDLMIFLTATIVGEKTHPEAQALEEVERDIYDQVRTEQKDTWGRLSDKLSDGDNEIVVAIGQGGNIHSEGEPFSIEQIKALFTTLGSDSMKLIVIRPHPRAPQRVVDAVHDAAIAEGLKVELDQSASPLVPAMKGGK